MSESSPNPPADDDEWANFDLRKFVVDTIRSAEYADTTAGVLEDRVARIEECIAARWPRRWLLWARLRREIRASAATFGDSYIPRADFLGRRFEWASQTAMANYDRSAWRPRFDLPDQVGQDPAEGGGEQGAESGEQGGTDPGAGFLA